VAAHAWKCLGERSEPGTIILFGAVHYPGVHRNAAFPGGAWETPLGDLEVDGALARRVVEHLGPSLISSEAAHEREHSLEVQAPFIKALFPRARILPIAVPPRSDAAQLGERLAELTGTEAVIAVGSSDLTHYGERYSFAPAGTGPQAHEWMKRNDRRILSLIETLDCGEVHREVAAHHNACGPGAIAATLAFARAAGRQTSVLLEYTTSHDVVPEPEFNMAVGYAGVVF
jgi:hypothetical protein